MSTEAPVPFTFQNRKPKGIPTGGQFAASARDESSVPLVDYGHENWTIGGALEVGQWAEGEHARVRLIPEEPAPVGEPEQALVLDVQVRDDHPSAGEPAPDSPGWSRPAKAPIHPARVPADFASTPSARGRFGAFALRQFDNLAIDFGLAWGELGEAFDMSVPPIR